MFVGLEIYNYEPLTLSDPTGRKNFTKDANIRFNNLSEYVLGSYKQKRVLDAKKISETLFPVQKYDIFLSHSHGDFDEAVDFAVALKKRDLNVFVDSCVWGHYGDLIKSIAKAEAGSIDSISPDRIIEIAADAHMLLASAIQHVIARTDVFAFLNTQMSMPLMREGSGITFSPWIFSELEFSFLVEHSAPLKYSSIGLRGVGGIQRILHGGIKHLTAFHAFNDHLIKLSGRNICTWYNDLPTDITGEHSLDFLYNNFNLPKNYLERRQSLMRS
jgi:hypothetical protein